MPAQFRLLFDVATTSSAVPSSRLKPLGHTSAQFSGATHSDLSVSTPVRGAVSFHGAPLDVIRVACSAAPGFQSRDCSRLLTKAEAFLSLSRHEVEGAAPSPNN